MKVTIELSQEDFEALKNHYKILNQDCLSEEEVEQSSTEEIIADTLLYFAPNVQIGRGVDTDSPEIDLRGNKVTVEKASNEIEPFWSFDKIRKHFNGKFDTIQIKDLIFSGHPEYRGLGGDFALLRNGEVVWEAGECDDLYELWNYEFLELFRDEYFETVEDIPAKVFDYHFSKLDGIKMEYPDAVETGQGLVLRMEYNGTDH